MTKVFFVKMLGHSPQVRMQAAQVIQEALSKEFNEEIEVIISEGIDFIDKEELLRVLTKR